ncbi:MAG: glycosyltransferase family 4 protein [Armatimonadota bacterium]|nr:glycosyltransferase family 4 protein [Armatimonadota bacterium]
MRRILYVDPAPFAGGAQQSLRTLVECIHPEEFRPLAAGSPLLRDILPSVPWLPLDLPPLQNFAGKPGRAFRFLFQSLMAAGTLRSAIRLFDVKLLHANGRGAFLPSLIACKTTGVPLVWHARDLLGPLLFDRFAARCANVTIVPSLAMVRRLWSNYPGLERSEAPLVRPSKIHVIPNGVDTDRFRPFDQAAARQTLKLPVDRFIIGNIGQWVPWKRVDLFLEAAKIAYAQNPQLYFLLCGGPPPGEGAQLLVDYNDSPEDMGTVLPWTDDVPMILAALDVLAHPAEQEAFGRTVVEAMSCGRAVIGANGGGVAETIVDGSTGLLFQPGNAASLAVKMLSLSHNRERTAAMGRAGRQRVEEFYTAQKHAQQVQEVYRRMLD